MRNLLRIFLTVSLLLIFLQSAKADLEFEITNQQAPKTKILFFGFDHSDPQLSKDSSIIFDRIQKNLVSTGLFEIIKDSSLPKIMNQTGQQQIMLPQNNAPISNPSQISQIRPQIPQDFNSKEDKIGSKIDIDIYNPKPNPALISVEMLPDFSKYRAAEIGAILVAQLDYDVQGNLEIRLRLWDVLDQAQLFGKFYSASHENYQKLANKISNQIFSSLTGEKTGHFDSKIVYISESGGVRKRTKKVSIIDFDGQNQKFLTDGRDLVLTPIFSKDREKIFYVSYFSGQPQVFEMKIGASYGKKVGGFYAPTFAANAHPIDSNIILLSAIYDGNSDIYELYIKQNRARRLTKNSAIDTTPSYSPDAQEITFASNRSGSRQIYLMDVDGKNIEQISKGQGAYSKPIFSPDGQTIAFTVSKRGQFFVGIMSKDGTNERLLADGYMIEGAKFSPNGRYLIYSKKRGPYGKRSIPRLFTLDISTGHEYEIPLPENEGATDPDWVTYQ